MNILHTGFHQWTEILQSQYLDEDFKGLKIWLFSLSFFPLNPFAISTLLLLLLLLLFYFLSLTNEFIKGIIQALKYEMSKKLRNNSEANCKKLILGTCLNLSPLIILILSFHTLHYELTFYMHKKIFFCHFFTLKWVYILNIKMRFVFFFSFLFYMDHVKWRQ